MIAALLLSAVMAGPAAQDTVLDVRRGDRLVVENFSGTLSVSTWNRDVMEVRGREGDRTDVSVSRSGSRLTVQHAARRGRDREVDLVVRVPAWLALDVGGRELEVTVRGLSGGVEVRNIEGDIDVQDTSGSLRLRTVDGEVTVRNHRGTVEARSQGDDVTLIGVVGDVDVESGNGDLLLDDVDGSVVRAETLDGDVRFSGPIRPGGRYSISVHDGDAIVAVPASAGLDVSVSTFDGEFMSDFPVILQSYRGGRAFEFTLGRGGASLEIQVFDGEIRLLERR